MFCLMAGKTIQTICELVNNLTSSCLVTFLLHIVVKSPQADGVAMNEWYRVQLLSHSIIVSDSEEVSLCPLRYSRGIVFISV